jgi:hypothetical protein
MASAEKLEQPATTLTSWDTTFRILRLMTDSNRRRSRFVQDHREILQHFYDAYFDMAAGNGEEKLDTLNWHYTNRESQAYNPRLFRQLKPYVSVIRARFPMLEFEE